MDPMMTTLKAWWLTRRTRKADRELFRQFLSGEGTPRQDAAS